MAQRITDLKELVAWNEKRSKGENKEEKLPIVAEWFYDHWMALVSQDEDWTAAQDHYVAMIKFHELCNKVTKEVAAEQMYKNIHSYASRGHPWILATKKFYEQFPIHEYHHQNMQAYEIHCKYQQEIGLPPMDLHRFLEALTYGDNDLAIVFSRPARV